LLTPTEADKIGHFGRYRYIGKTQVSANYIGQADISVYLYKILPPSGLGLGPDEVGQKVQNDSTYDVTNKKSKNQKYFFSLLT